MCDGAHVTFPTTHQLTLKVSQPDGCSRSAAMAPPPPCSAARYLFRATDLNWSWVPSCTKTQRAVSS